MTFCFEYLINEKFLTVSKRKGEMIMESVNLFSGINKVSDPNNPTDIEKKHTPSIEIPGNVQEGNYFAVIVTIGKELAHPDEYDHFIQWLELYTGDIFLTRIEFTPKSSNSPVSIQVKLDQAAEIRALIRCNLHGLWESKKRIDFS